MEGATGGASRVGAGLDLRVVCWTRGFFALSPALDLAGGSSAGLSLLDDDVFVWRNVLGRQVGVNPSLSHGLTTRSRLYFFWWYSFLLLLHPCFALQVAGEITSVTSRHVCISPRRNKLARLDGRTALGVVCCPFSLVLLDMEQGQEGQGQRVRQGKRMEPGGVSFFRCWISGLDRS